jgi:hypothetical protein
MRYIDCFNGDADGICALTQLRLAKPARSELITGVKRDISLLKRAEVQQGDYVSVLDVSLDKNRDALISVLQQGADVLYMDHHFAGDIPDDPRLEAHINTSADVCTSLLMNQYLKGEYLAWAVVGCFGDNLDKTAAAIAKPLGLDEPSLNRLRRLGILINYNGYGSDLGDLYFHPVDLFKRTVLHESPLAFMLEDHKTFEVLDHGYEQDIAYANNTQPQNVTQSSAVYVLPNESWARRVSGVFGNSLANQSPDKAHAVLTEKPNEAGEIQKQYVVSVRAPLSNKQGADEICRQFETGGGRAAAAGINQLPESEVDRFIDVFSQFYA